MRWKKELARGCALMLAWIVLAFVIVWLNYDQQVSIALRIACAVAAWIFVWRFSRVDWKATEEGEHIMGYTLITAIFMTLATVVTIWGRFEGIEVVTLALYGWLLALLWERHRLFTKAQRDRLAQKENHDDDSA